MTSTEKRAQLSFKKVEQFLGNVKILDWKKEVSRMVHTSQKLNGLMSLKLHFMDSLVEYFPEIFGDYSEEQDIKGNGMKILWLTTVGCWKEMHLRKKVWKKKCHDEGLSNAKECAAIKKFELRIGFDALKYIKI